MINKTNKGVPQRRLLPREKGKDAYR